MIFCRFDGQWNGYIWAEGTVSYTYSDDKVKFERPDIKGRTKIYKETLKKMKKILHSQSKYKIKKCKYKILFYDLNLLRGYYQNIKKLHMDLLDSQIKRNSNELSFLSQYNFYNFSTGKYNIKSDVSGNHIVDNGFEIYYMKPSKQKNKKNFF